MDSRAVAGMCDCLHPAENYPAPKGCCGRAEYAWREAVWESDYLTRTSVLEAIAQAEQELADWVGYYDAPHYIDVNRPDAELLLREIAQPFTRREMPMLPFKLPYGQLQRAGAEILVPIASEDGSALVASPTVSIVGKRWSATFTLTDEPENQNWFVRFLDDEMGDDVATEWEIKPVTITVTASGGNYLVSATGYLWDIIKPETLEGGACCDSEDDLTCYASKLEFWQWQTVDEADHGQAIWTGTDCNGEACTESRRGICVNAIDRRLGIVQPLPYEYADGERISYGVTVKPVRVSMAYRAGLPLTARGEVDKAYALAVANLAAGLLPCNPAKCDRDCATCGYNKIDMLRGYPKFKDGEGVVTGVSGDTYRVAVSKKDIDNCPFHPLTFGSVTAYRIAKKLRKTKTKGMVL
jgi:hypothetical protein